ncbi:MAG TPA: glycoside hydrolase family 1 protein [Spirochaetota bacterium]|nr:glycoside hydrolase family 1 protein [Spirochaetota bacterium]HOL56884.1 glycoside hydrolase family 1 protein [Spirochaetota bacterium]HPP04292.1 glycoside hydrolase family 1 protein [Spirochaetota bacterium]
MEKEFIAFNLPLDFKLGTATASLQIEGGDTNNNWYRWCELKRIKDGSHCKIACDHWNRVDEDIELMKTLNCEIYRMSLEWSRIEPQKDNFNLNAINHYKEEIKKLKDSGIEPLVTLHHFSNPIWFEDMGGWSNPESIKLFERYTEYVVANLGEYVSEWITINEPNVYLYQSFIVGNWPPGEKGNIKRFLISAKNLIIAHIFSYRKIHEVRLNKGLKDTKVGVANHIRVFDPKSDFFLDRIVSKNLDKLFHEIFITGMSDGLLIPPVGRGYPLGKGKFLDFFGINYYSRDIVSFSFNINNLFAKIELKEDAKTNDLGWEIYPEGIYRIAKKYYERFKLPIYITENGIADAKDNLRLEYIYFHLYYIKKAIDEGIDIKKYFHWTLTDNFEWTEGESARFGLIEMDFKTQKRTIRKSGYFFSEIVKNKGITEEMIKKFLG